ncbi:hypothetical protein C8J57DRAFT_1241090, partial [Mycena rebaudengoi]
YMQRIPLTKEDILNYGVIQVQQPDCEWVFWSTLAATCLTDTDLSIPPRLCTRYLTGILALPGFWLDLGAVHKRCCEEVLSGDGPGVQDIGVGVLPCAEPREADSLQVLAYEGVDILADTILVGISKPSKTSSEQHIVELSLMWWWRRPPRPGGTRAEQVVATVGAIEESALLPSLPTMACRFKKALLIASSKVQLCAHRYIDPCRRWDS